MPHARSQLLLQLAQAAASRQQGVLPQLAVNAWDIAAGPAQAQAQTQAQTHPQPQHQHQQPQAAASRFGGRPPLAPPAERLAASLGLLQLQQHNAFHTWGPHHPASLGGSRLGDAAAPHDTGAGGGWLSAAQIPGGAQRALFGFRGSLQQLARQASSTAGDAASASGAHTPLGPSGCGRKPRFNSSVSLNKAIMQSQSVHELHAIVSARGSSFDFFNISSAIARVPKLAGAASGGLLQSDPTARALVDSLAALMAAHIDSFDARGLANSAWALGKMRYHGSQTQLPALIAAAALAKLGSFSAQNVSNLLWALVYLHHRDEALMAAAAKQVVAKVNEFKPQELANVLWALASLEYGDAELMMQVAGARALTLLDQFKEQELANIVWAHAKLRHAHGPTFDALLAAVKKKLPHFQPQGVSNIGWALAAAGHRDGALLQALLDRCKTNTGAYDVQGLSNLLWACATLGHRDDDFVAAATRECRARIDRLNSQHLSNVLWSLATLNASDARLGSWAEAVLHKLDTMEAQGLANTAWAFAKLGFGHPVLFEALAEAALTKLDQFTPQGLSSTAWAHAAVGHYHPLLMQSLAQQAVRQAGSFSPLHCANLAAACASLGHYDAPLLNALVERLTSAELAGSLEPPHVAASLHALARLNHPLEAAAAAGPALVAAAKAVLPAMGHQELCNTVWALGVLGQLESDTCQTGTGTATPPSGGAGLSLGGQSAQASSWGALGMSALPGGVLGMWGGAGDGGFGSSVQQLVPALGVWGSGSFAAPMCDAAAEPSLLQQLSQMQQQQQVAAAAWDAFVAADGTSPDASEAAAQRTCQQADGPCPRSAGTGGSPDSSSSGGSASTSASTSGTKPAAAPFIWGDLATASIWAA